MIQGARLDPKWATEKCVLRALTCCLTWEINIAELLLRGQICKAM
jgi:hypothetical protein